MKKLKPSIILTIIFALITAAAGSYACIIYSETNHYVNDGDQIIASEIMNATEEQSATDQDIFFAAAQGKQYDEFANPIKYRKFQSGVSWSSVEFNYPYNWSSYKMWDGSETTSKRQYAVYFDTNYLTDENGFGGVTPTNTAGLHSLYVKILDQPYPTTVLSYQTNIKDGLLTATPYAVPGHDGDNNYSGVLLSGQLENGASGKAIVLKTRDRTLIIGCDIESSLPEFTDIVMTSFKFAP